jgi:muconate/chloromuconate cycloisomerase
VKIVSIETVSDSIPLIRPIKLAFGERRNADHVVARVTTNEGVEGFGEVSPFSPFCSETKETVTHYIRNEFSPIVCSHDPFDLSKILESLDRVSGHNRFAKAAIDVALHDALGAKLRVPVNFLLGGKQKETIPIAKPIHIGSLTDMVEEARESVEEGFKTMKVYVGLDPERDVERVKEVRKAVGSDIAIKVDVNQRWSPKLAIKTINRMERYDLQLVEQPIPAWNLDGLSAVCKSVETPIAVDESLYSPHDAIRIIKKEAADVFNIYVSKSGGLHQAKKIVNIAESAGIPCLVGSLYELGIGTAAGVHLACSSSMVKYACDLIGPTLHEYDIVEHPLEFKDGVIRVPNRPGLGVGSTTLTPMSSSSKIE